MGRSVGGYRSVCLSVGRSVDRSVERSAYGLTRGRQSVGSIGRSICGWSVNQSVGRSVGR